MPHHRRSVALSQPLSPITTTYRSASKRSFADSDPSSEDQAQQPPQKMQKVPTIIIWQDGVSPKTPSKQTVKIYLTGLHNFNANITSLTDLSEKHMLRVLYQKSLTSSAC